jgi:hypothetical protein
MIVIPLIAYILSVACENGTPYSATIRDNKLIVIYQDSNSTSIKFKVFELKEGATIDIFKSGKTFDYGRKDGEFALVFMDTPDNVQNDKNKLWLRFESYQTFNYNCTNPPFKNWMGSINLDDMSLENHSGFIKFPTNDRFPAKGYTINKIASGFGSALYITGGVLYSKKNNTYMFESIFFKYNFTTRDWVDMNTVANIKIKPLFGHKSVVFDNRYLLVLGGFGSEIESISNTDSSKKYYSIYNMALFDTFTNNWEYISIKPDIFENSVATIKFDNFLATIYNDKVVVLGGYIAEGRSSYYAFNNYFGVLDFKSKSWAWSPISIEDGINYSSKREGKVSILFNDQIIVFTGK